MSQQILFDLDDTLIYCNRYFHQAIDRFAETLVQWFEHSEISLQAVKELQAGRDALLIAESGFKSEHFPQSFIDTYEHLIQLTGKASSPLEIDKLWKMGLDVYGHDALPYPFMEDTLQHLAQKGHELHLYTGGEQAIQLRKINDLALDRYFEDRIYIRQMKNNEALDVLLSSYNFDRDRSWMIGNSIRNDIVPALHAGINAIHVITPDEWSYNIIDIDVQAKGAFESVHSLQQIPSVLSRY